MKKLQPITEKELRIQDALGSLPEEYRNGLCRYVTPEVAKGQRTCRLCSLKCIDKGDKFYLVKLGGGQFGATINICKTCSWLTIQTVNRIIDEYNTQSE